MNQIQAQKFDSSDINNPNLEVAHTRTELIKTLGNIAHEMFFMELLENTDIPKIYQFLLFASQETV